ncbi:MAG: FAD-dependent thymidylate synthase [Acidobacteria bacterium]|nr:FAD-dependent thymidylate synthase [Acidobacteriota bacterium]
MPRASELIGRQVPVLDKGYVMLVDVMGSDEDIAAAARVSYGEGTKQLRDDARLIDFLMRMRHTSPFEMAELKFEIKLPIFCARQMIRHRTASVNEISGRYSVLQDEYFVPTPEVVGSASSSNRQARELSGSAEPRDVEFCEAVNAAARAAFDVYGEVLGAGVPRELARTVLPLATYTKWVWKQDLHNLLHFLKLRTEPHAQHEMRAYAAVIEQFVAELFPLTYEAWRNHVKEALTFSADEQQFLRAALAECGTAAALGQRLEKGTGLPASIGKKRRVELAEKLQKLVGLQPT